MKLLDGEGYPTDEFLVWLRSWKYGDCLDELLDKVMETWWAPDWGITEKNGRDVLGKPVRRMFISTGGWSGNESIIEALRKSAFWMLYWVQSRRGGHYIFEIPKKRGEKR